MSSEYHPKNYPEKDPKLRDLRRKAEETYKQINAYFQELKRKVGLSPSILQLILSGRFILGPKNVTFSGLWPEVPYKLAQIEKQNHSPKQNLVKIRLELNSPAQNLQAPWEINFRASLPKAENLEFLSFGWPSETSQILYIGAAASPEGQLSLVTQVTKPDVFFIPEPSKRNLANQEISLFLIWYKDIYSLAGYQINLGYEKMDFPKLIWQNDAGQKRFDFLGGKPTGEMPARIDPIQILENITRQRLALPQPIFF